MNSLARNLADSVERECNVLSFTGTDHQDRVDRLDDVHRRQAAETEQRIAQTKRDLRKTVAGFKAEIAEIERKIAEAKAGASRKIEMDEKILTKCRAFLSVE